MSDFFFTHVWLHGNGFPVEPPRPFFATPQKPFYTNSKWFVPKKREYSERFRRAEPFFSFYRAPKPFPTLIPSNF